MISDEELKKIKARLIVLEGERTSYLEHWRQLSEHILPRLGRYFETTNDNSEGQQINQKVLSGYPEYALDVMISGLSEGMTSPTASWFKLTIVKDGELTDGEKSYLEEVEDIINDVLHDSNFYKEQQRKYEQLGLFGVSPMMIVDDTKEIVRFHTLEAGEYVLAQNERNEIDTMYTKRARTVRQVVDQFGINNVSERTRNLYKESNFDKEIIVVHVVEPRQQYNPDSQLNTDMKYRSLYYEIGAQAGEILLESGYREKPFSAPRWFAGGNDTYGRSRAMGALPNIKQLYQMILEEAKAISKQVNPPLQGPASLKNNPVSALPNGVTYHNGNQQGYTELYRVQIDMNGIRAKIEEIKAEIDRAFFVHVFQLHTGSDRAQQTAYETSIKEAEKLTLLGPFIHRIIHEDLKPVIERVFDICEDAKILPEPPGDLSGAIDIEFVSTLAQSQNAADTIAMERLVAYVGNIVGVAPEVVDVPDWIQNVIDYAEKLGVPSKQIRTKEQAQEISDQKAEQAAQQQGLDQLGQVAESGKTLSETPVGAGQSALDAVTGLI